MLDHLLTDKNQAQPATSLDLLLKENKGESPLNRLIQNYILACKVEGKSPSTIVIYSRVVHYFSQFARVHDIPQDASSITASDIRLFLLFLREKDKVLSSASINAYYRALNTFFNWLQAEGFLEKNPMQNIKPPKIDKKIIKPFSLEDIGNLLTLCSGNSFLDLRNRAIILVFLDTGLRLAELASIQRTDVSFDRETIKVMGKGAKERVVRIGKTAQKALLKYLLSRDDKHPCLWVTEERRPMKRAGIQTAIKRMCKRIGVVGAKPGPHSFRHTFGTWALLNGATERELQLLLGHSTQKMVQVYTATITSEHAVLSHRTFSPVDRLFKK